MHKTTMHRAATHGAPNKRKEREAIGGFKPSPAKSLRPPAAQPCSPKPVQPSSANQLLAGYLAHEYLTKGTLFGQRWDPVGPEATRVAELRKAEPSRSKEAEPGVEQHDRYVEVASLLKSDGAHLPGIVNPTQLARFLHV
ncbi:uncharacterized protein LOC131154966 [Malania oleifera]|uniref:uncharacterized protein LOC131154966 n=1 Tax=Malania oleifera TaxID=397392 RepID=UPI0025ADE96F|nr:uncharacterized protein LOC131154966 [Malania oleifera]